MEEISYSSGGIQFLGRWANGEAVKYPVL